MKKIRINPIPAGLSKQKLMLVIAVLALIAVGALIYVLQRDQAPSTPVNDDSDKTENFTRNDPTGNVDDILAAGAKPPAANQPPAAKITASNPSTQDNTDNQANQQEAKQLAQELKAAMRAPLNSNQLVPHNRSNSSNSITGNQSTTPANEDSGLSKDDAGMTAEKRNFLKANDRIANNVLSTMVSKPVAPLVLSMGTKIPAQLDQEINSDLPGQIYGHVSRDVFDSRTHSKLLIPAGSNLVGTYDSSLAYGQERLLVAWKRVNFPNGQWIDIQGMGGADPVGAGFGDQVDNHYWRIFGATFLTSVLAAGAQLSQPQQSNAFQSPGVGQTIGQSAGTQIANTGTLLMQKNINIQPTLHIRAGFEFTVEVNKDIVFPDSYTGNKSKS